MSVPRIALTPGEPGGIGPDLVVKIAQQAWPVELVAICDPKLLVARAQHLGLPLHIVPYQSEREPQPQAAGSICVLPIALRDEVTLGQLNVNNGPYVLDTLQAAAQGNLDGRFAALVTGPVHKGIINQAGVAFSGHTEFFAEQAGVDEVVMMLATTGLRVALVTTHLPLSEVAKAISAERLEKIIEILHADLRHKFGIKQPRIYVCGLNPHAGEDGHLGREELDIIGPCLNTLRECKGYDLIGPLPADTLFQEKYLADADAVLAMYHDQGLPVLKYKGFGKSVNITLGLPFIRTSVDHGTALDLAGSAMSDTGSMLTAIKQAITLVTSKDE